MLQHQSAGFVLFRIEKNEKLYLLLQHAKDLHWDFPKGGIEAQETKQQAALRELKEETGIELSPTDFICPDLEEKTEYNFTDKNGNTIAKTVFFFIAQTDSAHPVLSHEHIDYKWLTYDQALKQLTYRNNQIILTNVHHFLNNQKQD